MLRSVFVIFFAVFSLAVFSHPLHLTITNIDIQNDTIKASIRFFEDDFTSILVRENLIEQGVQLSDTSINFSSAFETFISKYFVIKAKKRNIEWKYFAKERGELTITLSFYAIIRKKDKELNLTNLLMTKYFGDQTNLVIIHCNDTEKGIQMDSQKTQETIYL